MNRPSHTAYALARGVIALAGAFLGLLIALWLIQAGLLDGVINLVYLSILGLLAGFLLSPPLAARWAGAWRHLLERLGNIPPEAVLAAGIGATIALIITVLLNSVLKDIPGFTWYWSLLITLVLVTASGWFFVVNRQLFSRRLGSPENLAPTFGHVPADRTAAKVMDTSAIIDGRIVDVLEANFLDGTIVIPKFILAELQNIADSSDPLRRKRGRRGLEILDRLMAQQVVGTEIVSDDFKGMEADDKLIKLCLKRRCDLLTTDYNLSRVAALQGVKVLNLNQLASAVKALFLPGERLSLHVVKEGREAGQGLAYLEDGTMVVVEDAGKVVGSTVEAMVTSTLQTNMGRMIFARLEREAKSAR